MSDKEHREIQTLKAQVAALEQLLEVHEETVIDQTQCLEHARRELESTSQRNEQILASAGEGIYGLDLEGKTTFVNPAAATMLGYEPEELMGIPMHSTVHHTKRDGSSYPREICPMYAALQEGMVRHVVDEVLWRKDGTSFPVDYTSTPIRNEGSYVVGAVVTFRDISERTKTEAERDRLIGELEAKNAELERFTYTVMHQEEKIGLILEGALDAVIGMDSKSIITSWNSQAEAIFGWSKKEVVGRNLGTTIIPHQYREAHERGLQRYLATGEGPVLNQRVEITALRRDGTEIPVELSIQSIHTKDGQTFSSFIRDISERHHAEAERDRLIGELEAKNAELERFTYTVSHDLKSPLVTIQGFLGLVEQDARANNLEQLEQDLQRIRDATTHMQRLLAELLELSRIGRMISPSETVVMDDVVCEAVAYLNGAIVACGVQLDIASGLPLVTGDRSRLLEVVQNLVENGIKFMGEQPDPRIEIGVRQDGEETIMYIRDNGTGIEACYQDKIFGLFERLDARTEGTGIGLSLVKRIIEVQGGRIWVESEGHGHGCTFCFTLPFKEAKESEMPSTEKS